MMGESKAEEALTSDRDGLCAEGGGVFQETMEGDLRGASCVEKKGGGRRGIHETCKWKLLSAIAAIATVF
jgi:hypothetical protein